MHEAVIHHIWLADSLSVHPVFRQLIRGHSKKDSKGQESIQSNTTSVQGYQMGK